MNVRRERMQLPNWSIPALYAAIAILAGLMLPRLEASLFPASKSGLSAGAAVAIFSSVGSGMIALTGIVFALAFVMVQFSATAYSPRLALWLASDRVLWHSVGLFSATFLYSIAAIAWVDRPGAQGTPFLSAWLVIVLLLASVAMFIALIERISLLQINRTLDFTTTRGRRVIEETYPPLASAAATAERGEYRKLPLTQTLYHAGAPRTVQALDVPALLALSKAAGGVVVLVAAVGDSVVEGTEILRVFGGRHTIDEGALRDAFELGLERTFTQDPKYAVRLLVDIAIRALSPAVNDPTTAVQALDQLEDLLRRLGSRRLEIGALRDETGLRVVIPYPAWHDFLELAFDEIRYCGASSVQVMRRMKALIADLITALPEERRASLRDHQRRLEATVARSFPDMEELEDASTEDKQGLGTSRAG
ncbi:MAG TPA: DUF2254 domain-containing protein [Burkholderiaceae bacterium]|nr:DUF2254 domain-containing protein [Burkholderiaceae bacterium]